MVDLFKLEPNTEHPHVLSDPFEIAFFLSVGVMLTRSFVITPLLIVLLLFTNDFVTMLIATDTVSYSQQPDR